MWGTTVSESYLITYCINREQLPNKVFPDPQNILSVKPTNHWPTKLSTHLTRSDRDPPAEQAFDQPSGKSFSGARDSTFPDPASNVLLFRNRLILPTTRPPKSFPPFFLLLLRLFLFSFCFYCLWHEREIMYFLNGLLHQRSRVCHHEFKELSSFTPSPLLSTVMYTARVSSSTTLSTSSGGVKDGVQEYTLTPSCFRKTIFARFSTLSYICHTILATMIQDVGWHKTHGTLSEKSKSGKANPDRQIRWRTDLICR